MSRRGVDDGQTTLHMAANYGHEARVRLLLENGADAVARDDNGQTAWHAAVRMSHEKW